MARGFRLVYETSLLLMLLGMYVTSSYGMWCIASSTASEADVQNALDWACGPGNVDCSAIQPGQPDNLFSHASFAFNSYYQENGATDIACSFGGAGSETNKNPSYDNCLYLTSGAAYHLG